MESSDEAKARAFVARINDYPFEGAVTELARVIGESRASERQRCLDKIERFVSAMSPELDESSGEREAFQSIFSVLASAIRSLPPALESRAEAGWVRVSERIPAHGRKRQLFVVYEDGSGGVCITEGALPQTAVMWTELPPLPEDLK